MYRVVHAETTSPERRSDARRAALWVVVFFDVAEGRDTDPESENRRVRAPSEGTRTRHGR